MITINICGGLGNQLFQIFSGITYASKTNQDFCINEYHYNTDDPNITKRYTYWENILLFLKDRVISRQILDSEKKIIEESFSYKELPLYDEDVSILGFFQSYKYLDRFLINRYLDFDEDNNKKYKNICSIHFRFGDYKKYSDYHFLLDESYYIPAVEFMVRNRKSKFLLFYEEDDKLEVKRIMKQVIHNVPGIIIKKIDTNIPDYEQLIIMSKCDSNIIANSTFSWWGAYLNDNPDKIVIRPLKWFGPKAENKETKDLFPPHWITI